MKTAVLAGATGLVGSHLLKLLSSDPYYTFIVTLSRKEVGCVSPKHANILVDFAKPQESNVPWANADVFCSLGTTIRQAGSQEAFRRVDFEYVLSLANIAHHAGAAQFLMVTALGSNKSSRIFYNRVKGEVEEAVSTLGFGSLHIFQPSMLLGDRKDQRSGESVGKIFMQIIGFLIPRKYKAIHADRVARAMVATAKKNEKGMHIHSSDEMQAFK